MYHFKDLISCVIWYEQFNIMNISPVYHWRTFYNNADEQIVKSAMLKMIIYVQCEKVRIYISQLYSYLSRLWDCFLSKRWWKHKSWGRLKCHHQFDLLGVSFPCTCTAGLCNSLHSWPTICKRHFVPNPHDLSFIQGISMPSYTTIRKYTIPFTVLLKSRTRFYILLRVSCNILRLTTQYPTPND